MDLGMTEQQQMLQRAAREFFERECPPELARELDEKSAPCPSRLWREMARLGWLGIAFPREYGGEGLGIADQGIVVQELGRTGLASPYISTVALCGEAILALGAEEQKRAWLPRIARGDVLMAAAFVDAGASHPGDVKAVAEIRGNGYILNGTKGFVHDARTAGALLFAAVVRQGGRAQWPATVFLVDAKTPGVEIVGLKLLSNDAQDEVTFANVAVRGDAVIGGLGEGAEALSIAVRKATALKCAEMVGAAEKAFELSLDYAKRRSQFGKPIGAFQAVQHKLVDMLTCLESSRLLAAKALWALGQGQAAVAEVAAAKARVSDACTRLAYLAHAVHAGIGYIKSYDLHLYTRRLMAAEVMLGTPDQHREVLANEMRL